MLSRVVAYLSRRRRRMQEPELVLEWGSGKVMLKRSATVVY